MIWKKEKQKKVLKSVARPHSFSQILPYHKKKGGQLVVAYCRSFSQYLNHSSQTLPYPKKMVVVTHRQPLATTTSPNPYLITNSHHCSFPHTLIESSKRLKHFFYTGLGWSQFSRTLGSPTQTLIFKSWIQIEENPNSL